MKKKLFFATITFVIMLSLLEAAARLLEARLTFVSKDHSIKPGWQTEFFASLFDWHEPDPDLLWKFKANLNNPLIKTNSHGFIGKEVKPKKDARTFRILLIGDSSP
ncbi:MAG: hypothetical protein ACE5K8_04010, partial [Candidatus Zixiibacteriota bacterium]